MKLQNKTLTEIIKRKRRKRIFKNLLFCLAILVISTNTLSTFLLKQSGIMFMAHRGITAISPENTLPAIAEAILAGCDFVEIDVQLTKDNKVILLHDASFKRVAGIKVYPCNLTYEEIQDINVGYYKSSLKITAPLLEDVIRMCKGRIKLNIELKDYNRNANLPAEVVRLIQKYDMESECVITSASVLMLSQVHAITNNIPLGIIIKTLNDIYNSIPDYISIYSVNYWLLTPNASLYLKSRGKTIYAWTVNESVSIKMALNLGVSAIITDKIFNAKLYVLGRETIGTDCNSLEEQIQNFLKSYGLTN